MWLVVGSMNGSFIFYGTAREQPSWACSGSLDPVGCQAPAQLHEYEAVVSSRITTDPPPGVREEIGRLFPETAEAMCRTWV